MAANSAIISPPSFPRWICALLASALCLLSFTTKPLHSQDSPTPQADPQKEQADVTALVTEVVNTIVQRALHPLPKPAIYQKAWLGLTIETGRPELSAEKDFSSMPDQEAELAFINALNDLANAPGQRHSLRELAETAMQSYCRQHDPYTRYIRSEEYHHIQLMEKSRGSHIGMSIHEKDRSYFCYPIPDGPAANAGLKPGDRLISIDGRAVDGRSLAFIVSLIKGAPGTKVNLRVEHGFGRSESLSVLREEFDMPPILVEEKITGLILKVRRFNAEVLDATHKALKNLKPSNSLTIDLRGCGGGNLDHAINFARLFLQQGETIVTLRSRDGPDEVYTANAPPQYQFSSIVFQQDEGTASAAEMVIAAIINSKAQRATNHGPKSFGKGVMTIKKDLQGGGALLLTNAELIAPQGRSWNETGLVPALENKGNIFPETALP